MNYLHNGCISRKILRSIRILMENQSKFLKFEIHISVHRKYTSKIQATRCNVF